MTVAAESIRRSDELQRFPMSWEEYIEADVVPSEYYGGALVVAAQPSQRHQDIQIRLYLALRQGLLPGTKVTQGWGWIPTGVREELGPDLMVHDETDEQRALSGVPHLVVEIVSSNRANDYVAKVQRYARWGAPCYWVVDPRDHEVVTMDLADGIYVQTGRFKRGEATLRYGDVEVPVDIDALLA
ncbi:Uma2 family endonuclease [Nocardioides sp. LML1-1-1.1]|uniref:Uma2 family endonuclease n=1 Tax=Nocardioides sp. LML1-1-1.1 TaxID=3135248 RepID=UPI00342EE20E